MPGGDGSHVRRAVAEDVGEGFVGFAMAAGGISVGPSALHSVGGYTVEAGTMDESPVFETNIKTRVMP